MCIMRWRTINLFIIDCLKNLAVYKNYISVSVLFHLLQTSNEEISVILGRSWSSVHSHELIISSNREADRQAEVGHWIAPRHCFQ